jgi:hypothetical protein
MNIEKYLSELNTKSQSIFKRSLKFQNDLGKSHHFSACVYEFTENIHDAAEKKILNTVSSQLETATLNATLGMYRQAFSSLRLALEMGLGAANFSVNKIELHEWLDGRADIKWSSVIDEDNGVLSVRFSNAFFQEFSADIASYRNKTVTIYRKLSEYVHGNNETWLKSGLELHYNEDLLKSYFKSIEEVAEVILYVLCCRYLKSLSQGAVDSLQFIPEEMNHISYIREYFGGPKD